MQTGTTGVGSPKVFPVAVRPETVLQMRMHIRVDEKRALDINIHAAETLTVPV